MTGVKKKGKELSCGRTKRSEPRHSKKDLRVFRKQKVSKGYRSIRRSRYEIRPGDRVLTSDGKVMTVNGTQNRGRTLSLDTVKTVKLKDLAPASGKDKKPKAIAVGQRLALKGRKEKHKVLAVNEAAQEAVMHWYKGVPYNSVTPLSGTYGGWEDVKA